MLAKLLNNIDQGKSINFEQLLKYLPKHLDWSHLFMVELAAKNKHRVTVKNQDAFEQLLLQSQPPTSRSAASAHAFSSSHSVNCDSAYMLCFPAKPLGTGSKIDGHILPQVKVITAQGNTMQPLPFVPCDNAILIENQDCFFQADKLMSHYAKQINLATSDIYFSAGSRILNDAFSGLLSRYTKLQCLFDYDLAGLRMMRALRNKYAVETQYLLPDDMSAVAHLFKFQPKETQFFLTMLSLCKKEGFSDLAAVIQQSKAFMEQEALLHLP